MVQKALDCDEDVRRLIVRELLADDIAKTLTSKHCSHVWAKVMEIANWTQPVPPIFAVFVTLVDKLRHFLTLNFHILSVNNSMRGQWAALATDETGSLVIQVCYVSSTYLILLTLLL